MRNYLYSFAMAIALLIASCQVASALKLTVLNESFDNITSGVPTGWSNSDYDCSSSYIWQSDASGYNGTRGMKFNTYSASNGKYSALKTPVLNLAQDYTLRFKYQNYSAGQLDVRISLDGGQTYSTVIASNLATDDASEWKEVEYSLSAYTGQSNVRIVFYGVSNYGYQRQYLDDVVIETAPTCKNPTGMYISNLTTTTADLNWSLSPDGDIPTRYSLVVKDEDGNTVVNDTNVAGTAITYTLNGLAANTTYTVSMRGNCYPTLGGMSSAETFTFTTACVTKSIPYTENFDNITGTPDCTTSLNAATTSYYKYGTSGKCLGLTTTADENAYIVFPSVNHAANDIEVTFMLRAVLSSSVSSQVYQVGIVTDLGDIESSFEPLFIDSAISSTTWQEVRMNTSLASVSTSPASICIFVGSGNTSSILIDDISIHAIPTCIRPEQFKAYNPTASSVDLSWTTSNASQHIIYITDSLGNTTTQMAGATSPYTVTGLQSNADYTIRMRGYCGGTDTSEYAAATAYVHTLCQPLTTAIWFEGAENTTGTNIAECWLQGTLSAPTTVTTYDDPFWSQTQYHHTGTRGYKLRNMSSGISSYMTSQGFHVDSAYKYQASIWVYRPAGTSNSGEGLNLWISTQPDNTAGATNLGFINRCAGNSPTETAGAGWYQYSYPIADTGDLYLVIEGVSKGGNSTYFDDIEIELAPTCLPVNNIALGTATLTDNTISWTSGGSGENSWILAYTLTTGTTVVSSDSITVNTPSYTFTGLSAASNYTVDARVYASCSATDMSTMKRHVETFTTPCGTISNFPYFQDFEGTVPPNCWTQASLAKTNTWQASTSQRHGGSKSAYIKDATAGSITALTTNELNFTAVNGYQVSFWMFRGTSYQSKSDEAIHVYVHSTDTLNESTATELGVVNQHYLNSPAESASGWYQYTFDVPTTVTGSQYVSFCYHNQYGTGAYIDDVLIREAPTCRDLAGATVSDIQPNSFRVTMNDTASAWDISYGPTGTAAASGTIVNVVGRTDTVITGLTANQAYDVYVRRHCSATDLGAWTMTPITVTCTCTDLTATTSNLDAHTATVTTDAQSWEISYGASGTTAGGGTVLPVTGTVYNFTNLTPSTDYVYYVRRNCGNSVYSDWSTGYTFRTTSVPDSLPYSTGFEVSTEDAGWTIVDGSSSTNVFTIGNDANGVCSGSRALYITDGSGYGYSNSSSTKTYAYRTIYFPAGVVNVSFSWKCTGGESSYDFGRVMLVPASEALTGGTGTYYSSVTWPNYKYVFDPEGANKMNLATGDANGWNTWTGDISISTDSVGVYNFVIMWNNDGSAGSNYPIAIDNVRITRVTCIKPNTSGNSTDTTITVTAVSQSATTCQVAISSNPIDVFGEVTGDLYYGIVTSGTPITVSSGLTPNTAYYYTARAICGVGDTSDWADAQTVRTACAAMSLPYTEGFEDEGSLNCWNAITTGSGSATRNTTYKYAGAASCKITDATAASPQFNVTSLAPYMLTGQAYSTTDSTIFSVGVIDDPSDASTYEELGQILVPARNTWTEFTTYFTNIVDVPTAKHFAITADATTVIYVDDLYLGLTPTCPKPTDVTITNVLAHTFDIAWTDNTGSVANSWVVRATPYTAGQQTITQVVTTNPATISGLEAASSYSIEINAICSATDTSLWSRAGDITTACDIVNAPYEETFEYMTASTIPNCWDNSASTTSTATSTSNFHYVWGVYEYGGNKMIRMNNYWVSSGIATINTPIINLAAGSNYTLYFDYCNQSSSGALDVDISTDGGTTWSSIGSYSGSSGSYTVPGSWTTISQSVSSYAGNNIMLRFKNTANYGSGAIFVDNVKVQQDRSCATPSDLTTVSAPTDNSIEISWDTASTVIGSIVRVSDGTNVSEQVITTNPYTITGLTPATNYTISVASICGVGDTSYFCAPITVATACGVVTPSYTEDFEDFTAYTVAECWDNSSSTTSTATSTPYYVWGVYQYNGNKMLWMYNWGVQSGDAIVETPPFSLNTGAIGYDVEFDYCHQATCGSFTFEISSNGGSSWTTLGTYSKNTTSTSYSIPSSWTTATVNIPASYVGDTVMFRFNTYANYGSGSIFMDNFKVKALRSCTAISSLRVDFGATDATVYVNDTASAHQTWQYVFGTAGFDTTGVALTTVYSDTIPFTGLTPLTAYDIYVRAYCDAVEQSEWIKTSFTTTSAPATLPYVCHFNDSTENSNWQEIILTGSSNYFRVGTDTNARNVGEPAALYVSNGSGYTYSTGSTSRAAVYRLFRFSTSQYVVSFDWKCTGGESTWDFGRFYFIPASTGVTLPPSGSFSASNWPSDMIALDGGTKVNLTTDPEWNHVEQVVDMTNQSGSYYLVFAWVNDGSTGTANYPLSINNVQVSEVTCFAPVNITTSNITTTSADVTFTDPNAGGGTIRYWYNTSGNAADSTNIATAAGTTVNLTNLSPSQKYYIFMRSVCSATDQSQIVSAQFQTLCGAITAYPYTEGFENSFLPTCWSQNGVYAADDYGWYDPDTLKWMQYSTTSSSSYVHSGSKSAHVGAVAGGGYYLTATGVMITTPQFHFDSLREYNVKFYMYRTTSAATYTYSDELKVYLSRTPNSISGATLLSSTTVGGASSSGMNEITFDLPQSTKGDYYLVFSGGKEYAYSSYSYLYFDDVTVSVYPTCRDLSSDPTVLSTTATTMTVSAPKGVNHQGVLFAYAVDSTSSSVADSIGTVYSTSGTATITGLTAGVTYKVWARGVCSATDSTVWTNSVTGTTMTSDCFEPQGLRIVGNIGATDVTLTWGGAPLAVSYDYQVVNTPMQGNVTSDTLYLTGLSPKTRYTVQVRTNCQDGSQTNWTSITFTTILVPGVLPYSCDFETVSENNQWEYVSDDDNYFMIGNATSNGGSSSLYVTNDGSSNAYSSSSNVSYATRFFQLTAGQYAYSFDWDGLGESSFDYARAFIAPESATLTAGSMPSSISTSGTPSGWVSLDGNAKFNQNTSGAWQTMSGTFNLSTSGNYNLVFIWKDDGSVTNNPPIAIDNVMLQQLTCPQPTISVDANQITQTTAKVAVVNPNTSDSIVYAVSTGSVGDAFFYDTINDGRDTILLTNLSSSTGYNVYVKVVCGAGDESFWSSASFRTLCGTSTLPYTESFEDLPTTYTKGMIEQICWNDLNASTSGYPRYYATTTQTRVSEGSKSLQFISSATTAMYLILPDFGNIGNCRLTYDAVYETTSSYCGLLISGYMTDPTNANSFVAVHTPARNTTMDTYTVDFANIPNGARLAIKYADASSSNYWAWLDNIHVFQLVAGPTYTDTICYNEPYTDHGFNVTSDKIAVGANTFSRLKSGASGAPDTMITANVYCRAEILNMTNDSIDQWQPYTFAGITISNPQTRIYEPYPATAACGCDSIIALSLKVVPTFHEVYDTICEGASYQWHGQTYTLTGDYPYYGTNHWGRPDTTTLHLFAVPTTATINDTTCKGTPYVWYGQSYTQTGTYTHTSTGIHGCPFTETLNLYVFDGDSTLNVSICQGGQYIFVDTAITTAGTYIKQYYDIALDCYFTITLNATVTPKKTEDVYDDACEGIPYYGYGISGVTFTADSVVTINTKDANLCDSTANVHITFHATERSDTFAAIHQGETFTWYGNTYNTSGDYTENLQSVYGCDSIVTLHLDVKGVGVDNVSDVNLNIVPNPVNAGATAFVYGNFGEVKSVEILNNYGQVIDQFEPKSYPIEVSGIAAAGLYYVRVTTVDGEVHLQKLVVK